MKRRGHEAARAYDHAAFQMRGCKEVCGHRWGRFWGGGAGGEAAAPSSRGRRFDVDGRDGKNERIGRDGSRAGPVFGPGSDRARPG